MQVLYITFCFFCLVILSVYTANLTTYLTISRVNPVVASLDDLLDKRLGFGVNPNGSTAAYFAASEDPLARALQPAVQYCGTPTCMEWLRSGRIGGFVSDRPLLAYQVRALPARTEVHVGVRKCRRVYMHLWA